MYELGIGSQPALDDIKNFENMGVQEGVRLISNLQLSHYSVSYKQEMVM